MALMVMATLSVKDKYGDIALDEDEDSSSSSEEEDDMAEVNRINYVYVGDVLGVGGCCHGYTHYL